MEYTEHDVMKLGKWNVVITSVYQSSNSLPCNSVSGSPRSSDSQSSYSSETSSGSSSQSGSSRRGSSTSGSSPPNSDTSSRHSNSESGSESQKSHSAQIRSPSPDRDDRDNQRCSDPGDFPNPLNYPGGNRVSGDRRSQCHSDGNASSMSTSRSSRSNENTGGRDNIVLMMATNTTPPNQQSPHLHYAVVIMNRDEFDGGLYAAFLHEKITKRGHYKRASRSSSCVNLMEDVVCGDERLNKGGDLFTDLYDELLHIDQQRGLVYKRCDFIEEDYFYAKIDVLIDSFLPQNPLLIAYEMHDDKLRDPGMGLNPMSRMWNITVKVPMQESNQYSIDEDIIKFINLQTSAVEETAMTLKTALQYDDVDSFPSLRGDNVLVQGRLYDRHKARLFDVYNVFIIPRKSDSREHALFELGNTLRFHMTTFRKSYNSVNEGDTWKKLALFSDNLISKFRDGHQSCVSKMTAEEKNDLASFLNDCIHFARKTYIESSVIKKRLKVVKL